MIRLKSRVRPRLTPPTHHAQESPTLTRRGRTPKESAAPSGPAECLASLKVPGETSDSPGGRKKSVPAK